MKKQNYFLSSALLLGGVLVAGCTGVNADEQSWIIDSQQEWSQQAESKTNLEFKKGFADPTAKVSTYKSKLKRFDKKVSAKSLTFDQSAVWDNWESANNVGPSNLQDAPVFLSLGPDNYWVFGRYGGAGKARKGKKGKKGAKGQKATSFKAEDAKLAGFDIPLQTTSFKNQYNAPGGLQPALGGYHAWQSRDMVNWVHHGPVSEGFSRWVTTAEYVDGKMYLYYDYPNDQDPHLYIDDNLFDGKPGTNMGMAFKDPSHGSDCSFIRDEKGNFHVIYEDWSPINARQNAWDSPLAGHAVSKDGIKDFKILPPAVDHRTKATGEVKEYLHPHWKKEHKDWDSNVAKYNVHEPAQNAYGDWATIRIGTRYYLFGDFDPAGSHNMSVARFTSTGLDKEFTYCGNLGKGHPDPDIGFANGKFYLLTQQKSDFVSDGPWVESVESRVGVDIDNDGKVDQWTDWQAVKETYDYTKGFAKHVTKTAASMDLSDLLEGYGFQFEFKMTDTTANKSKPIMDKVTLTFE